MATPISERMEALDLTDAALAASVGCERSMVTKIKLGKATPSLQLAARLGAALALPAEAFLLPTAAPQHGEAAQ